MGPEFLAWNGFEVQFRNPSGELGVWNDNVRLCYRFVNGDPSIFRVEPTHQSLPLTNPLGICRFFLKEKCFSHWDCRPQRLHWLIVCLENGNRTTRAYARMHVEWAHMSTTGPRSIYHTVWLKSQASERWGEVRNLPSIALGEGRYNSVDAESPWTPSAWCPAALRGRTHHNLFHRKNG